MLKKINCRIKLFVAAALILTALSAPVTAEVSYIFPCTRRYEVNQNGDYRTDYARTGAFNNMVWRTWAEFDLSALEGATVTGVGFRVHNDWSGSHIDSLRYSGYRPSAFVYPGFLLNGQTTYANKYDGFTWDLNINGAWTPGDSSEGVFFRPSPEQWNIWSRGNGNSIIEDIQSHIDNGKLWFTVGFGYLGGDWPCPNLRLSGDYFNPASVYMEVVTNDVLVLVPEKNLGSCGEGGETTPMTCQPINFATGNKYKKRILRGKVLPTNFRG